jgi:restriction system protein
MAVPNFQEMMRPVLELHADGSPHSRTDVRSAIAARFVLDDDDLGELLPSGGQTLFVNRVNWAVQYLRSAGLLDRTDRGITVITDLGRHALVDHQTISTKTLQTYPEFQQFYAAGGRKHAEPAKPEVVSVGDEETPTEAIERAYRRQRALLASELFAKLTKESPERFEQVVLDVLVAMGYDGSRADAASRLGKAGDRGVDGVIQEDRLGLDVIYVQAKRYGEDKSVSSPDIQGFVGALSFHDANKGVFITTARFTRDAVQYADGAPARIVLIDGERLANLMIDYGVGVAQTRSVDLKRIDEDYFSPDDATEPE